MSLLGAVAYKERERETETERERERERESKILTTSMRMLVYWEL